VLGGVETDKQFEGMSDGHVLSVLDESVKDVWVDINAIDELSIPFAEEALGGSSEVTCKQRQYFLFFKHGVEKIDVEDIFGLTCLEEPIKNAGDFGFHKLDSQHG
jgi:hypothetical protein